jgi:hypothetical protein
MTETKTTTKTTTEKTTILTTLDFKLFEIGEKKVGLNNLKNQYEAEFKTAVEGLFALELALKISDVKNNITNEKSKNGTDKERLQEFEEDLKLLEELQDKYIGSYKNFQNADGVTKMLAWSYKPLKAVSFKGATELVQSCYSYYSNNNKTIEETKNIKNDIMAFVNERLGDDSNFRLTNIGTSTLDYILNVAFIKSGTFNAKGVRNYETLTNKQVLNSKNKLVRQIILSTIGERVGYSKKDRVQKVDSNLYEI